jgi:hypothetical protein
MRPAKFWLCYASNGGRPDRQVANFCFRKSLLGSRNASTLPVKAALNKAAPTITKVSSQNDSNIWKRPWKNRRLSKRRACKACEAVVRTTEARTCTAVPAVAPSGQLNLSAVAAHPGCLTEPEAQAPRGPLPRLLRVAERCGLPGHVRPLSDVFLALSYTSHEKQGNRQVQYRFLEGLVQYRQRLLLTVSRFCSGGIVPILKLIWSLPSRNGVRGDDLKRPSPRPRTPTSGLLARFAEFTLTSATFSRDEKAHIP